MFHFWQEGQREIKLECLLFLRDFYVSFRISGRAVNLNCLYVVHICIIVAESVSINLCWILIVTDFTYHDRSILYSEFCIDRCCCLSWRRMIAGSLQTLWLIFCDLTPSFFAKRSKVKLLMYSWHLRGQSYNHLTMKKVSELSIVFKIFIAILTCREAKGKHKTNAGTNQS